MRRTRLMKRLKENVSNEEKHTEQKQEEILYQRDDRDDKIMFLEHENNILRQRINEIETIREDNSFLDEIAKNYDEIIEKLIQKQYDGIMDEILKEQIKILKRKLKNYEFEQEISNNPDSVAIMNQIINTCSKIMSKK